MVKGNISDDYLMNGMLEFRDKHKNMWRDALVGGVTEEELLKRLMRVHRYYFEEVDLQFRHPLIQNEKSRRLQWTGVDVLRIFDVFQLSQRLEETLLQAEIFDPTDLRKESPVRFLDEDDFNEVVHHDSNLQTLRQDEKLRIISEANLFILVVFYLKSCNRSSWRKA